MSFFEQLAARLPEYRRLVSIIRNKNLLPALVTGLSHIHKAHFLAGLTASAPEDVPFPLLVLCESEGESTRLCDDIKTMLSVGNDISESVACFPAKDFNLGSAEAVSREYEHKRLETLCGILSGEIRIVISTPEAASQYTIPSETLEANTVSISTGTEINIGQITEKLVTAGFSRCDMIEGVSQFSVRGSIIDIYPVNTRLPVRIELWGDVVDSVSAFDLETQRRIDTLKKVSIAPALELLLTSPSELTAELEQLIKKNSDSRIKTMLSEDVERLNNGIQPKNSDKYFPLVYNRSVSLFDYVKGIIISEGINCRESFRAASARYGEDIIALFEAGELCRGLDKFMLTRAEFAAKTAEKTRAYFDTFIRGGDIELSEILTVNAVQLSGWSGEYKILTEELRDFFGRGYAAVVFAGTEKAARTLAQDLKDDGFSADYAENPKKLFAKRAYILSGAVSGGYDYPDTKLVLISLTPSARPQAAGGYKIPKPRKKKKGEEIRSLSDIAVGDHIVHNSYGIGVFEGVTKLTNDKISKDYIKIKYAGTDVLYVPVTQLDLISRYIGNTDALKLNKLHTDQWQKSKKKAKAAATELAAELIELYSKRMKSTGFAFSKDGAEMREFENHFSYIETDDQLRCIEEMKADMETARPMDRLLCGDVGFGKTEVALRGAFKCIMDGKQCALLCPTTVLAWQHYQTVVKRVEGFPVNVELLSRFRSAKEIKTVLEKLKKGVVDMIIGTHRLIQNDVVYNNLGLVIIDEEQRFGVSHKDKFKEIFAGVDILTLSATPIPRTLNMAMSGIRDMSVIEMPPHDRQPVTTYVAEHDWGIVAQAIDKELRRNGQVYYIHNRVESIQSCAARIHELCPGASIGIAHGRMDEDELLKVWRGLLDQEIDILVCTTLIETGVDVPNCNTLIIENSDHMGLAQLHQLRGRVGRTNKRAYAYFTFKRGKVLSEIAAKRLNAIRDFTQFGSGFRIAMRDLEIRGAGSVLGSKQSGHLSAVGYEMYLQLLNEAVAEQQGAAREYQQECIVDIKTDAYIPEDYISNQAQRIICYKKIAEIKDEDDAFDVTDELIDRYGELPKSVYGLIEIAQLRNAAQKKSVEEIAQDGGELVFYTEKPDMRAASVAAERFKNRVTLNLTGRTGIRFKIEKGENPLDSAKSFMESYGKPN